MDLIGGDRALRVCDLCGGVDDHPRHSIAGTGGEFANPTVEVVQRVYDAVAGLDEQTRAHLLAELMDTSVADRHMDCCRAAGCPTGDCDRVPALTGADLLTHLIGEQP